MKISQNIKIQMNGDKLIFLNMNNWNTTVFQYSHLCEMKNKNNLKKIWGKNKNEKKLQFFFCRIHKKQIWQILHSTNYQILKLSWSIIRWFSGWLTQFDIMSKITLFSNHCIYYVFMHQIFWFIRVFFSVSSFALHIFAYLLSPFSKQNVW